MLKNYAEPLANWLREFPAEQLRVLQYEELIDPQLETGILQGLTAFLGEQHGHQTAGELAVQPVNTAASDKSRLPPGAGLAEYSSTSMAKRNVHATAAKCWPVDRRRLDAYLTSAQEDGER